MDDRVCVDLCALMRPSKGLLGPIHAYVSVPGGRTSYLSELQAGKEVLVVDQCGRKRTEIVGRVKIEKRPLILVEAKNSSDNQTLYSILLQNVETVGLVCPSRGNGYMKMVIPVTTLEVGDEVMLRVQGSLKCTLEGPGGGIELVRWHPRGYVVLAGSEDSTAWMWNGDKNVFLNMFSGHSNTVTCGDFTRDGKMVCTGSEDASLRIWNPRNGECVHVVRDHPYHTEADRECFPPWKAPRVKTLIVLIFADLPSAFTEAVMGGVICSAEGICMHTTDAWMHCA
ncbi:hypothetical protein IFM89_002808 [Coptis chinensis]|uniref:3-dehydroquinate synthase C-terminal domain-containing protein n=1 Tax=Coptis chinensis TaxID=261450 RepID=A0A835LQB3_9MAGN|nr:hypothetical protein IFM89_002808 [Coptis chinensis]